MISNFKAPDLNAPRYREKVLSLLNSDLIKEFKHKYPAYSKIDNSKLKYRFKNRELWQFKAVRQFKRAVAKTYPEQWPKYVVMKSKKRVAHMYKNKS
jgi:hypothetical protein